jgi:hypothetical protein
MLSVGVAAVAPFILVQLGVRALTIKVAGTGCDACDGACEWMCKLLQVPFALCSVFISVIGERGLGLVGSSPLVAWSKF